MKKLFLVLATALAALVQSPASAQSRFDATTPPDSLVRGDQELNSAVKYAFDDFQKYFKASNWKEAYDSWHYVFHHAPLYEIQLYTNGTKLFRYLINPEFQEDGYISEADRLAAYRDMIKMYKTRALNLDDLDALHRQTLIEANITPPTRGDIQLMLEIDRYNLSQYVKYPDGTPVRDDEKAYERHRAAMDTLKKYGGHDIDGLFMTNYINLSTRLCKKNPADYAEKFFNDYNLCYNLCDSLINEARAIQNANFGEKTDKVEFILSRYEAPYFACQNSLQAILMGDDDSNKKSYADNDLLQKVFAASVEQHKDDEPYLRNTINVLLRANKDTLPALFEAGEYAHRIRHSYESCLVLGKLSLKKRQAMLNADGTPDTESAESKRLLGEARDYLSEAMGYAEDDKQRGALAMMVAVGMMNGRDYPAAHAFLDKAETYLPYLYGQCEYYRAMVCRLEGIAFLKAKNVLGAIKKFDQSIECCNLAMDADASIVQNASNLKENVFDRKTGLSEAYARLMEDKKKYDQQMKELAKAQQKSDDESKFFGY